MSDQTGRVNRGPAGEPSMDEILASIRRILKEDEQPDEAVSLGGPEDEILVLRAEMEAKPEDANLPEPPDDVLFTSLEPDEPEPEALVLGTQQDAPRNGTEMEAAMDEHQQSMAGLVSETATAEITSALGPLVRGVSQDRAATVSRGGVTLEEIVREEIRPVLKAWLDTNLPGLVERIVRAEIARVIDRTKL